MKKGIIFLLIIAGIFFTLFNIESDKGKTEKPQRGISGTNDDPFAASRFRYEMIKGKKDAILPLARKNAIEYTKKFLMNNSLNKTNTITSWTALGPGNIGGRIRSIVIRPSNTSEILVGGVSGGIWKTTDGGATWSAKNDDGNPIAISCMVNDGDVVYAGTGEGWGNVDAVYGGGIWKSTDFGETWALLANTVSSGSGWDFKNVKQLAIDPSGNIYAVTKASNYKGGVGSYYANGGLWKSTDAGVSWSKINATSTYYYNGTSVIPISSTTILFATYQGGIFRTTDGGSAWSQITSGLPSADFGRIEMTQDPNSTNTIYAVFHDNRSSSTTGYDGLVGIYKSTDGGVNWSSLTKPGTLTSTSNRTYLNTQGWYDNVIAVDPHNSSNIYVGGVETMKSTDGGTSWSQMTYWTTYYGTPYVHADHHAIVFDPNTANTIYLGNDGGIWKTTDAGASWTALNNGLEITQYYGGAVSASGTVYMGGSQDNGHHKYNGSGTTWSEVKGGDGGYAAIDQTNSDIAYEEYVYLDIAKTTDGGTTWSDCQTGLTDAKDNNTCLFIAPFSMNPNNSAVLVAGSDKVWLTTNSAGSWVASSGVLSSGEKVSAVTVVGAASPFIGFAGTTDGKVFKCASMTGSGDTWTDISPTGNNGAWVRRISVDPNNTNSIYATYSGYNNDGVTPTRHIYHSTDQGTNWSDVSGDLPDVPVHSLVVDNSDNQKLYIGTETGVYQTSNGGTNWTTAGSGMPDYVPVDEVVLQSGTNKLFAFTHGRSVFVTTAAVPVELTNFVATTKNNSVLLNWETATEVNNYGFAVERKSGVENREWEEIGFIEGHGNSNATNSYSFLDNSAESGNIKYRLKQIDTDGTYEYSDEVEINFNKIYKYTLEQNHPNPFNPTTTLNYTIESDSKVTVEIFNILGQKVAELLNSNQAKGKHSVTWNAVEHSSGTYFARFTATSQKNNSTFIDVKKLLLIK